MKLCLLPHACDLKSSEETFPTPLVQFAVGQALTFYVFKGWDPYSPPFIAFKAICRACADAGAPVSKLHLQTPQGLSLVAFHTSCPYYREYVS